jgi:hypothetical protein
MTPQHPDPITPPSELVQKWVEEANEYAEQEEYAFANLAAQWGADQELEACCEWFVRDWTDVETADELRAARRPNPPSLKELALQALNDAVKMADDAPPEGICSNQADIIRRALEQLP